MTLDAFLDDGIDREYQVTQRFDFRFECLLKRCYETIKRLGRIGGCAVNGSFGFDSGHAGVDAG